MKERLISAFIALLITIPLLLLGGNYFITLVAIIGILGLKELLNLKKNIPMLIKIVSYISFLILLICGYTYIDNVLILNYSLFIIILLVLLTSLLVIRKDYSIEDVFFIIGSVIFLSAAFDLFIVIRDLGLELIIYLFLITITTDTFAYIIGSKYGKVKLMPDVSPKKSVEGFVGGLLLGTIVSTIFYAFAISSSNIAVIILLSMVLSVLGQIGDLVFSAIKRHYKIKDYSNIMPGHGGILDRLDSIIFVMFGYIIFSVIL